MIAVPMRDESIVDCLKVNIHFFGIANESIIPKSDTPTKVDPKAKPSGKLCMAIPIPSIRPVFINGRKENLSNKTSMPNMMDIPKTVPNMVSSTPPR